MAEPCEISKHEADDETASGSESCPKTSRANTTEETTGGADKEKLEVTSDVQSDGPMARPRTIGRQLSEKELEITYKLLGVHRCSNCKFTTNEKDLFTAHSTFCSKTRKSDVASSVSTVPQSTRSHAPTPGTTTATTSAPQPATTSATQPATTHETVQPAAQDESTERKDQNQLIEYIYTDDDLFKCVSCDLTWSDKAQFVEHIVCHLSESPYICITCKRNFESRAAIDLHIKQTHVGGSAKCGLMGIKKGRVVLEELIEKRICKVLGKIKVPETPRFESIQSGKTLSEQANETVTAKKEVAASEVQDFKMKMPVISSVRSLALGQEQSNTLALNTPSKHRFKEMDKNIEPESSVEKNYLTDKLENVTSIQTSGFLLSKPSIDENKQKHIDSLYGEFNTTTNTIIPTTVSSKIQSIINVSQSISTAKAALPKYVVKSLTHYLPEDTPTSTGSGLNHVGQSGLESNIKETPIVKSQGQPLLLVPVGPPIKAASISPTVQWFPNKTSTTWLLPPTISAPVIASQSVTYTVTNNNPGSRLTVQPTPVQAIMPTILTGSSTNDSVAVSKTVSILKTAVNSVPIATTTTNTETEKHKSTCTTKKSVVVGSKSNRSCSKVFFIRPGYGFTCEVCRKFTKDENIFYKHIWDHLHGTPRACSICSDDNDEKKPASCPLVCSVLLNIKKDQQQQGQESSSNIKLFYDGKKEIIEITDDDVNTKQPIPEVIVLDEEDDNNDSPQDKNQADVINTDQDEKSNVLVSSDAPNKETIEAEKHENSHKEVGEGMLESRSQNDGQQESSESQRRGSNESEQVEQGNGTNKNTGKQHQGHVEPDNVASENVTRGYNFTEDILRQSLSQTEEETESFVSQVLESTLNDFHPKKENQNSDSNLIISNFASKENQPSVGASKKDNNEEMERIKEFDSLVTSKHGPETFYLCGYEKCGFVCLSSHEYRNHLKIDEHKDEYCYICGHCGQKDYAEDNHVRHLFAHSNVKKFAICKCPVTLCKYKTNQIHLFKAHLEAHNTEEMTIKCTYCHTSFPSASCLVEHLKKNLLKFICCPYCSFKLTNKNLVRKHIRLVHKDRLRMIGVSSQIVCYEREINFYVLPKAKRGTDDVGQSNANVPSDTESLDIPKMVRSFAKDKTSAENEDSYGNDELDNDETEAEIGINQSGQHNIEEDSMDSSKRLPIIDNIGPKSYQCRHCDYVSYNQTFQEQHENIHNSSPERSKQYLCMICPKGHDTLASFKVHLAHHPGIHTINIYQCIHCSFRTNIKTHIMDHCADGHTEKTMFTLRKEKIDSKVISCHHCGFKSRLEENLALHTYHVHKIKPVISVEPLQKKALLNNLDKKSTQVSNTSVKTSDSTADAVESMRGEERVEDKALEKSANKKYKYHCEYCKDKFKHKKLLKMHIQDGHKDIPSKQFVFFKCKWCSCTSTMKDYILSHIGKVHPGKSIRILRKIEKISADDDDRASDSSDVQLRVSEESKSDSNTVLRETVEVPDGNIFKTPFRCPKCTFSTNLRLETMRHIKKHLELKPVRPCLIKSTARKSTSSRRESQDQDSATWKRRSSLIQDTPGKLQNPFKHLKEMPKVTGCKTENDDSKPLSEYYSLGEQTLHSVLSACFIQIEDDCKFQCRICQHKIAKKFVLHRHILDHLKIVFFRCKYCSEGEIERTLLIGHIQKEHSFKPLEYITVSKTELDTQFKERIFSLNFNETVSLGNSRKETMAPTALGLKIKGVKEYNEIVFDYENKVKVDDVTTVKKQWANKCPKCKYTARSKSVMAAHILSHNDPQKHFLCSVCDYRGKRIDVIKHIYSINHPTPAKTIDISETGIDQPMVREMKNVKSERESSLESNECMDSSEVSTDAVKHSETKASFTHVWKCKICGEKKGSKGSMYSHLRRTCKQNHFRCSLCKFWSVSKTDIAKHGLKRHSGQKVVAQLLPQRAKMLEVKIRKKQQSAAMKDDGEEYVEEESNSELDNKPEHSDQPTDGLLCQLCKLSVYESPMKLQYHINTVHRGCMIYCQECPYKTPLVKHMMNHCRNVHLQAEAKYASDNKSGKNEETTTHSSKKHKFEREEDVAKVKSETSSVCESIPEKGDKDSFSCPKCEDTLSCIASLRNHLFAHFNYKRYMCPYCRKTGVKSSNILKHVKIWHPNRQAKYKLSVDDDIESKTKKLLDKVKKGVEIQKLPKTSCRPTKLNQYIVLEEGVRRNKDEFYCDICGKQFKRACNVRRHIQDIHIALKKKRVLGEDSVTEQPKSKKPKLDTDTLTSPKSGQGKKESTTPSKLGSTVGEDSSKMPFRYKIKLNSDGMKTFCCSVCSYSTTNLRNMNSHLVNSHVLGGKFKCCYCDAVCTHRSNVYRHVKRKHPGKTMKAISTLTNETYCKNVGKVGHSLITEREQSPPPDIDGEDATSLSSYEDTSNLTKARRDMNTTIKFCCHLCDFETQSEYVFRIHLAQHTEFENGAVKIMTEMDCQCAYCSFVGEDIDALVIHVTAHMCEPRFQCVQCAFQGFHKTKLLNHTKTLHDVDNVLDRMSKVLVNGETKLIDLKPIVKIDQIKTGRQKKKYRRIAVVSDSDSSDNELNFLRETQSCANVVKNKKEEINDTSTTERLNLKNDVMLEEKDPKEKEALGVKVNTSSNNKEEKDTDEMNDGPVNEGTTNTQTFDTTSFDAQSDEDAFDNISEFSGDDNETQTYSIDHTGQMKTSVTCVESETHTTTDYETNSTFNNVSNSLNVCQKKSDDELVSMRDKESKERFEEKTKILRCELPADVSEDITETEEVGAVDNDDSKDDLEIKGTMKAVQTTNTSSSSSTSPQESNEKENEKIDEERDSDSRKGDGENVEVEMIVANEELENQEDTQEKNSSKETENDPDSQKLNDINVEDETMEPNKELEIEEDSKERYSEDTENVSEIGNTENCYTDMESEHGKKENSTTNNMIDDSENIEEDLHNENNDDENKERDNVFGDNEMEVVENVLDNNGPKSVEKAAEETNDTNASMKVDKMENEHSAEKDDQESEELVCNKDADTIGLGKDRCENKSADVTINNEDKDEDDVPETAIQTIKESSLEEKEEHEKMENMDVDELINFIDQTVKENAQSSQDSCENMETN